MCGLKAVLSEGMEDLTLSVFMAATITSAGRFSILGPRGIWTSDQSSNEAQEFLLLWSVASRDQKGSDLNVGDWATRGKIRLMPDEHPIGVRIGGEQPPIAIGAVVNLSGPNGHAKFAPMLPLLTI
jgi:hypothetical protein